MTKNMNEHEGEHERGTDKIAQANIVRTYTQEEHEHTCILDVCRKETAERFGAVTTSWICWLW